MLKALKGLLGKPAGADAPKKPAIKPTSKPAAGGKDFRAVAIVRGIKCCAAAIDVGSKPYLVREAPRLPLPNCTMPTDCLCKFKKAADRRDGDRRLLGATDDRWFAGAEKRKRAGRRTAKD